MVMGVLMNRILAGLASRLIRKGTLIVTDAAGQVHRFGDGTGEPVHIKIHSSKAELRIALDPSLGFPEAYMDGELDFLHGDPLSFLAIAYQNMGLKGAHSLPMYIMDGLRRLGRRFQQINLPGRSRRNVAHHYDLSGELYRMFLDEDMQYSCAYFPRPGMTLEEAQLAKKQHIAAKLDLKPGQKVLDIGSGWGGMGLFLAKQFDVEVLGVTLSTEQLAVANQRAKDQKLSDRVRFELADYRSLRGPFDRIVSVGMFEHVGVNHFQTFFNKCRDLLTDDGVMLLHTIGRTYVPSATAAFIRKYIFPGGYIPSLSEVMPAIEKSELIVTDIEILRLHYAETLKVWRERFMARRDDMVKLYDERFARMWEFYLAGSEASFRWQEMVNFQIQLSRQRETLPLTRDYMVDTERQLVASGSPARPAYSDAAE